MNIRANQFLKSGRYQLVHLLRRGGVAEVWRGIDTVQRKECAIKIVTLREQSVLQLTRLRNEAVIATHFSHPHMVEIVDAFEEEEVYCIVMALASGSLNDWIQLRGPVEADIAVPQFVGLLEALQGVHAAGVVHRDIKPANVLISQEGILQLADFGVAHLVNNSEVRTTTGAILGSLAYMSPEQRGGIGDPSISSDLYSLAITMTEALIGEPLIDLFAPRPGQRLKHLVAAELAEVLLTAAAYDVTDRYASAEEMADALRHAHPFTEHVPLSGDTLGRISVDPDLALPDTGVTPVVASFQVPDTPRSRSKWMIPVSLFLLGAPVILGGNYWFRQSEDSKVFAAEADLSDWGQLPRCTDSLVSMQLDYALAPPEALGVTAADLDGDQQIDLIFTNQLDPSISIYWGEGTGSLREPTTLSIVRSESRIGVGDLNEDGLPDLVIASPDNAMFSLRFGTGSRSFGPHQELFQGSRPSFPMVLDWDNDGHQDVMFTHLDCLAWRRGRGDGTFAQHECLGDASRVHGVLKEQGRTSVLVGVAGWLEQWTPGTDGWVIKNTRLVPLPKARVHVSMADIDSDGQNELYLFRSFTTPSLVRLQAPDWEPCVLADTVPLYVDLHTMKAVDVNEDGVVDFMGTRTCAGCTSNHVVYRGQRVGRVE